MCVSMMCVCVSVYTCMCDEDVSKAISDYFKDRKDIKIIRYFNNNGLGIILKE